MNTTNARARPVMPEAERLVATIMKRDRTMPGFARAVAYRLAVALALPGAVLAALQPPPDAKNIDPRAMIG